MSGGEVRRLTRQDIQSVQNLIERCLQLYMNQQEVVDTLLAQAKIEPEFTELVWQKLEEENHEFFKAYHLRLMVKQQIIIFNKLLEKQVGMMRQINQTGVAPLPVSNGFPLPQPSTGYTPEHKIAALKNDDIQKSISSSLPNAFTNAGSSLNTAVDMPAHATRRIHAQSSMLPTQSSNVGMIHGLNGGTIKTEAGHSGSPHFMFGGDGNVLEAGPPIGDASFSSVDSSVQSLNEPLLDAEASSFGLLGQIPRNFSLSDLAADFSHSSEILESYSRSPFLATDHDNFLGSREREENQGENKRLDTISEGPSYEDFGSD